MGCFPFANSRFQMGVTVIGFAEHFGLCQIIFTKVFPTVLHLPTLLLHILVKPKRARGGKGRIRYEKRNKKKEYLCTYV